MVKVNEEDTRMTSMSSTNFTHCSGVSIVDFINKCLLGSPVHNTLHAILNLISFFKRTLYYPK